MKMHSRYLLLAILLATSSLAMAAPSQPNPCGNHGNNCPPTTGGDNTATGGNGTGVGIGVGVGIGQGGSATGGNASVDSTNINQNVAQGGQGGQGGRGGDGGTGIGMGGAGGTGIGLGGSATQGQGQQQGQGQNQGQGQSQTNVGVNGQTQGQSNTNDVRNNVSNTVGTSTSTTQGQSQSTSSNASNNGNAQSTNVTFNEAKAPDRVRVDQAPSMLVSAPYATASCYKTGGGALSSWFGGASFSGGKIDQNCEYRELARVSAAIDPEGGKRVLCLHEAYQLANRAQCAGVPLLYTLTPAQRRGIVRPEGE